MMTAPGGSALLETDAALIKAMNELGPAVKTLRLVRTGVCGWLWVGGGEWGDGCERGVVGGGWRSAGCVCVCVYTCIPPTCLHRIPTTYIKETQTHVRASTTPAPYTPQTPKT
jgi:hypothetical protein